MTSLLDKMEPGRWYALEELPGFTKDTCNYQLQDPSGRGLTLVTNAFLVREVAPLTFSKAVRGAYRFIPTGEIFHDLDDVPKTYGDPPRNTGMDDIVVLFARSDLTYLPAVS